MRNREMSNARPHPTSGSGISSFIPVRILILCCLTLAHAYQNHNREFDLACCCPYSCKSRIRRPPSESRVPPPKNSPSCHSTSQPNTHTSTSLTLARSLRCAPDTFHFASAIHSLRRRIPPPSRWICRASLLETTGFLLCITPSTDCLSVSSAVFALALFPSHSSIQR